MQAAVGLRGKEGKRKMKSTVSYIGTDIKVGMPDYYIKRIANLVWVEFWGDTLQSAKAYADLCRITKDEGANFLSIDLGERVQHYPEMDDWQRFVEAIMDNAKAKAV